MHWQEKETSSQHTVPDRVQDICFRISAKKLPLDHISALSQSIVAVLPWLKTENNVGIHPIYYPQSGNGWNREEDNPHQTYFVSGRSRLRIRIPKHRIEDALELQNTILDINGNALHVKHCSLMPLSKSSTLFARRVIINAEETEALFVDRVVKELTDMGIRVRKLLCGTQQRLNHGEKNISTRSVMLADLEFEDSFTLQEKGLGNSQIIGCGLFIPHKSIRPTNLED